MSGFSLDIDLTSFWTLLSSFFNVFFPVVILLAAPAAGIALAMVFGDKLSGIFKFGRGR
jgi:hypothetical protein